MRPMRPIHTVFKTWLYTTIKDNAEAAMLTLAPTMPSDQLYELLVPDRQLRLLLQGAAENMEPVSNVNNYKFQLPVRIQELGIGDYLGFDLTMPVPKEWATILFPAKEKRAVIGYNNVLTQLMLPCMRVAAEWMTLRYVVSELLDTVNDRGSIRKMFPWIVEAINESEWATNRTRFWRNVGVLNNRAEREKVDLPFKEALLSGRGDIPRTTASIRKVCLSGSKLFSQVRMMKAVDEKKFDALQQRTIDSSSLVPNLTKALMSKATMEDLEAVKEYYNAHLHVK